jgi:hypothetical protein
MAIWVVIKRKLKRRTMRIQLLLAPLCLAGCALFGSTICDYAAPTLGIIANSDLHVVDLVPGGPAERAGVQVNDVLLNIRPTRIREGISPEPVPFEWEAVQHLIAQTTDHPHFCTPTGPISTPLIMQVERAGETIDIRITPGYPKPLESDLEQMEMPRPISSLSDSPLLVSPLPTATPLPTMTPIPSSMHYF